MYTTFSITSIVIKKINMLIKTPIAQKANKEMLNRSMTNSPPGKGDLPSHIN